LRVALNFFPERLIFRRTLMIHLTLPPAEAALLSEMLENVLSDLRMEIANTDALDVRESLKRKEEFLKRLLRQLELPVQA
jgi:hypothetical protein